MTFDGKGTFARGGRLAPPPTLRGGPYGLRSDPRGKASAETVRPPGISRYLLLSSPDGLDSAALRAAWYPRSPASFPQGQRRFVTTLFVPGSALGRDVLNQAYLRSIGPQGPIGRK